MTDLSRFPHREAAEMRAARTEHQQIENRGALLALSELLVIADSRESVNLGNLSCILAIIAARMPEP